MNQETKDLLTALQAEHLRGLVAVKEDMKENLKVLLEHFETVEDKLVQHDRKFEEIDQKFEKIDEKFEKIDEKFEEVHEKLDSIVETVGETKIEVTGLGHRVEVLERS